MRKVLFLVFLANIFFLVSNTETDGTLPSPKEDGGNSYNGPVNLNKNEGEGDVEGEDKYEGEGEDENEGEDEDGGEDEECRGDRNATSGCDEECKMRCPGKEASSCKCPINSCVCKTGFVFDPQTFKCVKLKDCSHNDNENCLVTESGETISDPDDDVDDSEDEDLSINSCSCTDDDDEDEVTYTRNITTTEKAMTTNNDTAATYNPTTNTTCEDDDYNITSTNIPMTTDGDDYITTEAILTTTDIAVIEDCPDALERFKTAATSFHLKFLSCFITKVPLKSFVGSTLATMFLLGLLFIFSIAGAVFNELSNALGLHDKTEACCVFRTINNEAYNLPAGIIFAPATDILANSEYLFTDSLMKVMEQVIVGKAVNYDSEQPDSSLDKVNKLIKNQTMGRISNFLTSPELFSKYSQTGFVSALYFMSKWQVEFEPKLEKGPFYVGPLKYVQASFMVQKGMYNYTESNILNAQIIDIPFLENKFSLFVILPKFSSTIADVIKKCNPEVIDSIYKSLKPAYINVKIPSVNITTVIDTVAVIKGTNITTQIFNETAVKYDGAFVGNKQPILSFGRQKNILLFTTEGGPSPDAKKPRNIFEKQYTFNANKAYIFMIRITKLGLPLFSGVVADPESTSVEF